MKSKIALLFIVLVYLVSFKQYASYSGFLRGGGDSWGYYAYLPASFIYHDLDDLQQTIQKRAEYNPGSVSKQASGYLQIEEAHAYHHNTVIKYTSGLAILYAPFFFAAHLFCNITHLYAADGYTPPYNLLIALSTLFYSIAGLWFLRKLLLNYFSDTVSALTLLCIALGTNLYFFSVLNVGMSHTYLFALYAICLYATDYFYKTNKIKYALLIGFCCGMITMIRPNEIIVLLFPLFWNVLSYDELKERFQSVLKHYKLFVLMLLSFIIVNLPQIIYWKALTGKLFFYSYTKEGFDFLHPHLKEGLFGFSNGWLSYTPIMIFAVAGLFLLPKYFRKSALATYLFLPVYIYVIYSWWCWQYINGFGSRPMIETYSILAFPFASFLYFLRNKKVLSIISFLLMAFFTFLNLFQTWQFDNGLIWTEDSNRAGYTSIFLKTKGDYNSLIAYDCGETQPDSNKLQFIKVLQQQTFDDSLSADYISSAKHSGKYAFELHTGSTPAIRIAASSSGIDPQDYIKISCWTYCTLLQYDHYKQAVLAAEFKHGGNQIRWRTVRLQNKIGNKKHSIWHPGNINQWQYVSFFVRVPHRFKGSGDELNVLAWNPGNVPMVVDDIRVELWKKE